MSYNTRRSGNNYGSNMNQRVMNNRNLQQTFVSGGQSQQQHTSQQQRPQQPLQQQQLQSLPQRQVSKPMNAPIQSPVRPLMTQHTKPAPQPQQQIKATQIKPAQVSNQQHVNNLQQQQQQPPKVDSKQQLFEPKTPLPPAPLKSALKKTDDSSNNIIKHEQVPQTKQIDANNGTEEMETNATDGVDVNDDSKKKTIFLRQIKAGKISKKEKRGRRNQRLRKILQPKNALMVLNELIGGHKFNIVEKDPNSLPGPNFTEPETFVASVTIEGIEHLGYGKNKAAAKTNAAEVALKHIITSKLSNLNKSTASSVEDDGDTVMKEEPAVSPEEEDVSWLHIASFAMHKLFNNWDSDGLLNDQLEMAQIQEVRAPVNNPPMLKKPAKQLPENPQLMNPVMLLNQMKPGTAYEDVAKEGNSPYTVFTVKTICNGFEFFGKGPNKKAARKNCAYAVCHKAFDINYPTEEFQPQLEPIAIN